MGRRGVGVVLAAVAATLLFSSVATSGGVELWREPQWELAPNPPEVAQDEATTATTEPVPVVDPDRVSFELPAWIEAVLRVLVVAALMGAVVVAASMAWHRRPRLRWHRRRGPSVEFEVLPDVASAVVDDAAAQRAALLTGEPRNAIVRCWLRLEREVAAAGLRRDPSATSAEFTEQVLARYSVDAGAIRELGARYREARFSEHPIDEDDRLAALDALDRLHAELGGSRATEDA